MDDLDDKIQQIIDDTGLPEETARRIAENQIRAAFQQKAGMSPIGESDLRNAWRRFSPKPTNSSDARPRRRTSGSSAEDCPLCKGAGYLVRSGKAGTPDFGQLVPCTCLVQRQQARAAVQRAAQAERLLGTLRGELGNLKGCTFETFVPCWSENEDDWRDLERAYALCLAYARQPVDWLYLWGDVGTGKSHLAAAIAQYVAGTGVATSYVSAPALFRFVRSGMSDHSADARLEALHTVDLLVIDDLGTEHLTAWATTVLFDLVNQRYIQDLPTVITSNLHFDDLPDRIADRIAERAQVLRLSGSSYRRRA